MRKQIPLIVVLAALSMAPLSGGGMEITAFAFSETTLDVTGTTDTVDCNITATGATGAGCVVKSPSGEQYGAFDVAPSGNDYTATVTIPADVESGTYTLRHIFAVDGTTEIAATSAEVVAGIGGPPVVTFEVTSTNEDVTALAPIAFGITPEAIDSVPGGDVTCDVTLDPTDTGTAHRDMSCHWAAPSGATKDSSGNPYGCASSKLNCTFTIPADAEAGFWLLQSLVTSDVGGNVSTLTGQQVSELPGSVTFINVSAVEGGDACARSGDLIANDSWDNSTAQTAASESYISTYVQTNGADALFAIGNASMSSSGNAAVLVRFNDSGEVESMQGSSYAADNVFAYSVDTWYQLLAHIDWGAGTYTLDVAVCGTGAPVQIARDAAFQTGAPLTAGMTHYAAFAPSGVISAVADLAWFIFADLPDCTPATGSPGDADGCGGIQ